MRPEPANMDAPGVLRVALAGLGLAAAAHMKGYAACAGARVAAVCDRDPARARRAARALGLGPGCAWTDYGDMLRRADIDAVDITTPTFLHAPMCLAALDAGKHVLCEKPLCRTAAEGEAVAARARARGLSVAVSETYAFLASHMKARALIEAGAIGRPLQVRQRHGAWIRRKRPAIDTGPEERGWRVDPRLSGGGAYPWIFDHAVHFFAAAEYFMLDRPIAGVFAVTGENPAAAGRRGAAHDPYAGGGPDIPIIVFRFADPQRQGVWLRAERLTGKYDPRRGFSASVIGDEGMIEVLGEGGGNLLWNGAPQHLLLHREGGETQAFRFDEGGDALWDSGINYYPASHAARIRDFVDAVRAGRPPRYGAEEGVRAVRCALAAIRSAQTGLPVAVDSLPADYSAFAAA